MHQARVRQFESWADFAQNLIEEQASWRTCPPS